MIFFKKRQAERIALAVIVVLAMLELQGCSTSSGSSNSTGGASKAREYGQYRVQSGDSISIIAERYGWDWMELARINRLQPPYTIHPGQVILLGKGQTNAPLVGKNRPSISSRQSGNQNSDAKKTSANNSATEKDSDSNVLTNKSSSPLPTDLKGWVWPASGTIIARFSSNGGLNKGIDISGTLGEPVHAALNGTVVYAGSGLKGYGELIIIKHSNAFVSAYGHNRRLLVQEGQQVTAGQVIAEMGSTGAGRVKLHFEIRRQGKPVDPLQYLPTR